MLPPALHNALCLLVIVAGFSLALFIALGSHAHG